MRCRCYCSGIWHLNLGTSVLGRCFRLFLLLLLVIVGLAIIFITLKESRNIWQLNFRAESHSLAGKTYVVAEATNVLDRNMNYGIVVDCGSSGSRVFVYFWPQHDGNPDNLLDIQLMRDANIKPVVKKVEPGLSAYADEPSRATEYLKPLLKFAAEHIPIEKRRETPLYIMATAGMRLLSKKQQEAILNNLRVDIPMGFDFLFTDTQLEVISGKQEGIYAWMAINYVRGKFDHGIRDDPLVVVELPGPDRKTHVRKRTVGIVDMGGASVQIAFEVPESVRFEYKKDDVPKELVTEFNLGCVNSDRDHHYRVYVTTFLGFGGNAVKKEKSTDCDSA